MYQMGEGIRPCPFPVTGNGQERATEPKDDHFSGRNLGMIPEALKNCIRKIDLHGQEKSSDEYLHKRGYGRNQGSCFVWNKGTKLMP